MNVLIKRKVVRAVQLRIASDQNDSSELQSLYTFVIDQDEKNSAAAMKDCQERVAEYVRDVADVCDGLINGGGNVAHLVETLDMLIHCSR